MLISSYMNKREAIILICFMISSVCPCERVIRIVIGTCLNKNILFVVFDLINELLLFV